MITYLAALAAAQAMLPEIDDRSLKIQASAEALQPSRSTTRTARPPVRRASTPGTLDLSAITPICRAAGNQHDPAAVLSRLRSAYALSAQESQSLRSSCAAYLAGRADARRSH